MMVPYKVQWMLNKTLQRTLGFQHRLELSPEEIVVTEWDTAMAGSQRNNFALTDRGGPGGGSSLGPKVRFWPCPALVRKFVVGRGEVDARGRMHSSSAGCLGRPDSGVRCRVAEILGYDNGDGDGLELSNDDGEGPDNRGCRGLNIIAGAQVIIMAELGLALSDWRHLAQIDDM